jgi:tetratricopeptide (TPR) repeat protein
LALLLALPLAADTAARIREANALSDQGKYDEALAIYKAILADEPSNAEAAYEIGLTYATKGDWAGCRGWLEPRVREKGRLQSAMYAILGNCLDGAGEADRAIAAYRSGLQVNPNDYQLLYNLAVSLSARNKYDEARELLKRETRIRPDHASAHLALAQIFAAQHYRTAAVASYLRFLSIEPQGERAKAAATAMLGLLNLGVEKKDAKNINVTVDPDAPQGEGDYRALEMALAMASAVNLKDEGEKSQFERTSEQIASVAKMIVEMQVENNYTADVNRRFLSQLYEKELIDAFAAVSILSLNLPGQAEWLKAHGKEVQAYLAARGEHK